MIPSGTVLLDIFVNSKSSSYFFFSRIEGFGSISKRSGLWRVGQVAPPPLVTITPSLTDHLTTHQALFQALGLHLLIYFY